MDSPFIDLKEVEARILILCEQRNNALNQLAIVSAKHYLAEAKLKEILEADAAKALKDPGATAE